MLVLSRKLGEKIYIGTGDLRVCVTVVDIDRGKIRLGIEAPRDISIYRAELLPISEQQRNLSASNADRDAMEKQEPPGAA